MPEHQPTPKPESPDSPAPDERTSASEAPSPSINERETFTELGPADEDHLDHLEASTEPGGPVGVTPEEAARGPVGAGAGGGSSGDSSPNAVRADGVNEDLTDAIADPRRASPHHEYQRRSRPGAPSSDHRPGEHPPAGGGHFGGQMLDSNTAAAQATSHAVAGSLAPGTVPAALSADEKTVLIRIAFASIESGLHHRRPVDIDPADYPARLAMPEATFVTIRRSAGDLIGCIGSLEPRRPLVIDVARNAYAAAFEDPRSPGLTRAVLPDIRVSISRLTPTVRLPAHSEAELLEMLMPGDDGLVLREGPRRSTFLPAVWETLENPKEFVRQLKRKAGLPDDYWSETIEFHRYAVDSIP